MDVRRWLVWLVVAMTLLSACVPIGLRGLVSTPESPPVAEVTQPIHSYRAILHQEIQNTLADGSTVSSDRGYSYTWQATDGPFGYDVHVVFSMTDPFRGDQIVVDEIYAVGEFFYRQTAYEFPMGWGEFGTMSRSDESTVAGGLPILVNGPLDSNTLAQISGLPIPTLLAQSEDLGEEMTAGLRATHYRLTDIPVLTAQMESRLGIPPPATSSPLATTSPLRFDSAQFDIWVDMESGMPLRYTLRAVGKSDVAGTGTAVPITIVDDYNVSDINNGLSVEVPAEILAAAAEKAQP